ncbi:glycosyltransferase family 4 protein [Acidobacteriota bacterium]
MSKSKRILMFLENNTYPQDSRVRHEAKSLTDAGYQVTIICPKKHGQAWRAQVKQVNVYRYSAPLDAQGFVGYLVEYGYSLMAAFLLSLLVFVREGFDIIHTHNPPDLFVLIAGFYKLLGKKFIFDQHDLSPELYFARFKVGGNRLTYQALLFFEWLSYRVADHVIATNGSYKNIQMQRGKIPEERITIVRNGPDLQEMSFTADHQVAHKGSTAILYVGDMGFHDGIEYLLQSIQHLKNEFGRTDFKCTLVGTGDAEESLKALSESLQITEFLSFTGWINHNEVSKYLQAADICVAPEPANNYNSRSTAIKIMEYMAGEKPIVAYDLPEHRVTAGDAAIYAKPNDELDFARHIASLMDNRDLRERLGHIGKERIESKLAWKHQQKYLLNAYMNL